MEPSRYLVRTLTEQQSWKSVPSSRSRGHSRKCRAMGGPAVLKVSMKKWIRGVSADNLDRPYVKVQLNSDHLPFLSPECSRDFFPLSLLKQTLGGSSSHKTKTCYSCLPLLVIETSHLTRPSVSFPHQVLEGSG